MKIIINKLTYIFIVLMFIVSCGGGGGGSAKEPYTETNSATPDTSAPFVERAVSLAQNRIEVDFSESINVDSALASENYSIQSNSSSFVPSSVESGTDDDKFILILNTSMVEGENYTLTVNDVKDLSGNKAVDVSILFTGKGPISAEITELPLSFDNSDSGVINLDSSNISAYQYSLNGSDWIEVNDPTLPIELENLPEGSNTIQIVVQDQYGNWQDYSTPTEYTWVVDMTPPTAMLENKPASITAETEVNITVKGLQVTSSKYSFNGSDWKLAENNKIVISGLDDGTHNLKVIASDAAGNWQTEDNSTQYSWEINSSDAVAVIETTVETETKVDSFQIQIAGENVTAYKFRVNGSEWSEPTSINNKIILSNLNEGNYRLDVCGITSAGKVQPENDSTYIEWKVDKTPPSAKLETKPDALVNTSNNSFKVSGTDVFRFQYRIDNENWSGWTEVDSSFTIEDVTEGIHTLSIKSIDLAGNEQLIENIYTWKVDLTSPKVKILSNPDSITNINNAVFSISDEDVIEYRIKIDDENYSVNYSSNESVSFNNLEEGEHTVFLVGKDAAGNWQNISDATTFKWTVDMTPPTIELVNAPDPITANTSEEISVVSSDGIYYNYEFNGSVVNNNILSKNILLDSIPNESNSLKVVVHDAAGNISEEVIKIWTVDTIAPIPNVTSLPNTFTNETDINITIAGTDVVQYKYNLNNGGWSEPIEIDTKISLQGFTEDTHVIKIIASDSLGNWQSEENAFTHTWEIDTTKPRITEVSGIENLMNTNELNISVTSPDAVSYMVSYDNGITWSEQFSINSDYSVNLLEDGNYTVSIISIDNAGNSSDAFQTSFEIDTTPPEITSVVDTGDTEYGLTLDFTWDLPGDAVVSRIQVATDSDFNNVVLGGSEGSLIDSGNVLKYTVNSINGSTYYARVKVQDAAGNWSDFGSPSNGITLVSGIRGVVENTFGDSIENVSVELQLSDGTVIENTNTDSSGIYSFDNVEIGNNIYTISASRSGYSPAVENEISVNPGEISRMAPLYMVSTSASDGIISGSIIDANDGLSLDGASVLLVKYDGSDSENVTVSGNTFETSSLTPGTYSIKIFKTGYYDLNIDNITVDGNKEIGPQSLCEHLTGDMVRVVLLWGNSPKDLDLHLTGPVNGNIDSTESGSSNRFHIYWNKRSYDENSFTYLRSADKTGSMSTASLVEDATEGFGPEAINIFDSYGTGYAKGTYSYTVHNWSRRDWYGSPIMIKIFDSQGLVREIPFPAEMNNSVWYWKAFQIKVDGSGRSNRQISVVNEMATLSYSDKSSMDWAGSLSGFTAYLINMNNGAKALLISILLLTVSMLFVIKRFVKIRVKSN